MGNYGEQLTTHSKVMEKSYTEIKGNKLVLASGSCLHLELERHQK